MDRTNQPWRFRATAVGISAVVALVAGLVAPSHTGAQEEPAPPVFPGGYDLQPLPGMEEYVGCPLLTEGANRFCLAATVNGDLQLGSVGGQIDDLTMVMAVAADVGSEPVLVPARGAGGPAAVPVPGGVLGIPELEPLLELDVLQLLSLSASPGLGELAHTGLDTMLTAGLIGFLLGYPDAGVPILEGDDPVPLPAPGEPFCPAGLCLAQWPEVGLGMPLTLTLNNLLLGTDCRIGPIDLAVTTGTTDPPDGVEPLTGASGALAYNTMPLGALEFHIDGMELVGNTFEVPGSDCAGILGAGDVVDSLLGVNPFDDVVNASAGLPSPAGRNRAELTVDLHIAHQRDVYGLPFELSTDNIDFGDVPIGTTAEETFTVTNVRNSPRTFVANVGTGFTVDDDECVDVPAGASCTMAVTFTPTSTSPATRSVEVAAPPDVDSPSAGPWHRRVVVTGVGV